jgi:hypothetical protein
MMPPVAVAIFTDERWQMAAGERAALEGLLATLRPRLALEIGSAQGACLRRIAELAEEVHSFDLTPPALSQPANVTLHTGDSHELLPAFLAELAEQERNVDLAIVDGDHSPEGVRRDLEDLLNSPALRRSAIVIHDTANPQVRQGLDATPFAAWPKVAFVDLDWVPGRLFAQPELRNELWYGLGLVQVDVAHLAYLAGSPFERRYQPTGELLRIARDAVLVRELAPGDMAGEHPARLRRRLLEQMRELAASRMREAELREGVRSLRERLGESEQRRERAERVLAEVMGSISWKATVPLRAAKRGLRRRAGG